MKGAKKMKTIRILLLVGFLAVLLFGIFGEMEEPQIVSQRIPTIQEVQIMVGAVPDGIVGKETLRLWELAICNQFAEPHMEGTK